MSLDSVHPTAVTPVSLSKTLHHCFILWMGPYAVGPLYYVTHVKEPSALIEKRRGSPGVPGPIGSKLRHSTL